jgi:hypothetical protein
MLTWLRRALKKHSSRPRIELEDDGFALVEPPDERTSICWASITRVSAFKRDHFTTDEVVLAFEVAEHPGVIQEVSEEWAGFVDLFGPMEEMLDISPVWYREIVAPAFVPMYRVLYDIAAERAGGGLMRAAVGGVPEYPCPCCGYIVFTEPPGSYAICPLCSWEDDALQLEFATTLAGGANGCSLLDAQRTFRIARPAPGVERDPEWRRIHMGRDSFEEFEAAAPRRAPYDDATRLYYWRPTFWRRDLAG